MAERDLDQNWDEECFCCNGFGWFWDEITRSQKDCPICDGNGGWNHEDGARLTERSDEPQSKADA